MALYLKTTPLKLTNQSIYVSVYYQSAKPMVYQSIGQYIAMLNKIKHILYLYLSGLLGWHKPELITSGVHNRIVTTVSPQEIHPK